MGSALLSTIAMFGRVWDLGTAERGLGRCGWSVGRNGGGKTAARGSKIGVSILRILAKLK